MVQFASYLRRVLRKTRLIFRLINGPNVSFEINFREKKIFKYVHVHMALRFLKTVKCVVFLMKYC